MSEELADERLIEAVKFTNALRALKKSVGWVIFVDIVNENIHDRTQQIVLQPVSSTEEITAQEFMKGEVTGMTTMVAFVDKKIDECEALIDSLEKKDNGEEESES